MKNEFICNAVSRLDFFMEDCEQFFAKTASNTENSYRNFLSCKRATGNASRTRLV